MLSSWLVCSPVRPGCHTWHAYSVTDLTRKTYRCPPGWFDRLQQCKQNTVVVMRATLWCQCVPATWDRQWRQPLEVWFQTLARCLCHPVRSCQGWAGHGRIRQMHISLVLSPFRAVLFSLDHTAASVTASCRVLFAPVTEQVDLPDGPVIYVYDHVSWGVEIWIAQEQFYSSRPDRVDPPLATGSWWARKGLACAVSGLQQGLRQGGPQNPDEEAGQHRHSRLLGQSAGLLHSCANVVSAPR